MSAPLEKTKTPGIYKRGNHYAFIYRVDGRQKWESARTLDEARLLKQARQTDVARGELEHRGLLEDALQHFAASATLGEVTSLAVAQLVG